MNCIQALAAECWLLSTCLGDAKGTLGYVEGRRSASNAPDLRSAARLFAARAGRCIPSLAAKSQKSSNSSPGTAGAVDSWVVLEPIEQLPCPAVVPTNVLGKRLPPAYPHGAIDAVSCVESPAL